MGFQYFHAYPPFFQLPEWQAELIVISCSHITDEPLGYLRLCGMTSQRWNIGCFMILIYSLSARYMFENKFFVFSLWSSHFLFPVPDPWVSYMSECLNSLCLLVSTWSQLPLWTLVLELPSASSRMPKPPNINHSNFLSPTIHLSDNHLCPLYPGIYCPLQACKQQ